MTACSVTYAQLLEANNSIQVLADESYWLCFTRTTQGSKLFPVSSYILLSYLNAFYRYPSLLRKVEMQMRAEKCGDLGRNFSGGVNTSTMGWCLPTFYLLGRELLINMGLLRPEDAVEDVVYILDFWRRIQLSYHRNDGHQMNREFGHRSQLLPERTLQVFEADLFPIAAGDPLHTAAVKFMATMSQFQFLSHCECRLGIMNHGPYRMGDRSELIVRDFVNVGEGDYPWLDGIVGEVPYAGLTIPMVLKNTHFHIVDDWGSFESEPAFHSDNLIGIGLYTSDRLTETYTPIAMESAESLTRKFGELQELIAAATVKLWARFASWSRTQMLEAGALVYFSTPKDLAHISGTYSQSDWMEIDERAGRFEPLLNDEFGNDCLTELVGKVSLPSQSTHEYVMSMHSDAPRRMISPIPYAILAGHDYTRSSGPCYPGSTVLEKKSGKWRTSRGLLTEEEYNRAARSFVPAMCTAELGFLDDNWLKYHFEEADSDEIYQLSQRDSRHLKGKGAGLTRAEIAQITRNRW
jgi:hypothetical protein